MKALTAVILSAGLTAPALADQTIGGRTVDCYCTDSSGNRVEMGELICLTVDGRSFMAQCQMSLNVPMWREISTGYLSSSLREGRQPAVQPRRVHSQVRSPEPQPPV
ncbi:hypothetical protein [Roseovarius pacificus]|uniref:hypothetical protein n=1 Tax=Roseovarius pacificus TaxID=337701 RepID=UPI00093334F9|nr:hypothetical protein [Roseovarius pacificus]